MSRRTAVTVAKRNESVVQRIHTLKAEHPFWGYRRIGAQLRVGDGRLINTKRVLRLMREQGLLVTGNPRVKATRTPTRRKPRPTTPNHWGGMDMTKGLVQPVGWVSLGLVLDWYTKKMVGHYAGRQAKSAHGLLALEQAGQRQCPAGVRARGCR